MSGLFVLDANVFIEAHRRYYGLDLCPGFWTCLRHYGERQRMVSIDRVHEELLKGKDALAEWVEEAPPELFVSSGDSKVGAVFEEMMAWVQRNKQFRPEAKTEFAGVADGWLAAYAKVHGDVVVTHEQYRPQPRRRVPLGNVCHQFDVAMKDPFEMLRALDVRFDWKSS